MEVAFEPYKKISFQSYMKFESSDAFAKAIALSNPLGIPVQTRLLWANNIVFRFFSHPPTETLTKEIINGHIIWDHVEFAPMPSYAAELRVAERPNVTISILDVSSHVVFGPVTQYIRDRLVKKKPAASAL